MPLAPHPALQPPRPAQARLPPHFALLGEWVWVEIDHGRGPDELGGDDEAGDGLVGGGGRNPLGQPKGGRPHIPALHNHLHPSLPLPLDTERGGLG